MTKKEIIKAIEFDTTSPDNIRLYHGTSSAGKLGFLKESKFEEYCKSIWNCSDPEKVYFYELERFKKCEGTEEGEDIQGVYWSIIQRANESGQIQEAILDNPGNYTYVFEFILPKEARDYIEVDDSCENMKYCGAVQMDSVDINLFIKFQKCTINIYKAPFFPKMAYFYISSLIGNEYACDYFDNLPKPEYRAIQILHNADTYEIFEELVLEAEPVLELNLGPYNPDHYRD